MVYSNDPENYDAHIPVTYDVVPPTITVDPSSILDVALQTGEQSEHMVTIGNTGGFDLEYGVDIVLNDEMGRTTTIDVVTRKDAVSNMAMRSPIEGRSGGSRHNNFESQAISNNIQANSYMNHPDFPISSLTRDGHLFMVFDGMDLNPNYEIFTWGGNEIFVEEGVGMDYGDGPSNALTYIQGDVWTGGFFMQEDLSHLWENNGQIGFALESEPNMPTLRLQFESGDARLGYNFTPNSEGGWHYTFALNDFVYFDGTSDFDPSNVNVFQVLSEGNGESGRVFRFDYLVGWEGMQSEPWITQVGGDQFGIVQPGAEPDELFFMLRADNLSSGMHYGDIVIK